MKLLSFFSKKQLPVTLQTEATECGLACLCMIANYYGYSVDLSTMRMKFSTSLKGISLNSLIDISAQINLGVRALRVDLESLSKVNTPAILHWDLNHFVVLKKVSRNKFHIHDPAHGSRVISLKEASEHLGVVLECTPAEFEKQSVPKYASLYSNVEANSGAEASTDSTIYFIHHHPINCTDHAFLHAVGGG